MFMSIFLIYLYLNKKNGGFFFVNFIPAFVDNYRKYQAVNFFKVTMVTLNDLHPLTNL